MSQRRQSKRQPWAIALLALLGLIAITWTAVAADPGPDSAAADHWSSAGDMPQSLTGLGLVAVGNHLTVLGGQTGPNSPVKDTRTVTLAANGSFAGGWLSSTMPVERALHGSQVYDNEVYIIGGGAATPYNSVLHAGVDANGVPFGWQESASLPAPRTLAGTAISGSYFYVAGGWDQQTHNEVYVSAMAPGVGLSTWQATTPLPEIRSNLTLTAANGYLYAIGGYNGLAAQSTVWRARVGSGGQLGAWETLAPLPAPRFDHAAVFFKGQLLVLGGSDGASTDTVYAADVNADGSLGPWQTNAGIPALPRPLDRHAAVVATIPQCGAVLYVAGGRSNGSFQSGVYRTDCTPTPPTFTPTPSATIPVGPWAGWQDKLVVLRPGGQRNVILNFGNQSPPETLSLTLSGPVYFTANGSRTLETTINVIHGSYPIGITARGDAAIGAPFFLSASIGASAAPPLPGVIGRSGYLPLTLRDYARGNETPWPTFTPSLTATRTPTPTGTISVTPTWTKSPTPSATSSPTITVTPSRTPSPTFTPTVSITPTRTRTFTPTFTPTQTRTNTPTAVQGIYGKVTYKGAAAANVSLDLLHYDGSSDQVQASTRTASDGTYKFVGVPSLPTGHVYYVRFNNEGNSNYLAVWFGSDIASYTAGASALGGNFDIADIVLSSPPPGYAAPLPITFQWVRRSITSESYRWIMFNPATGSGWAFEFLGYASSYTLGTLPSGASYNVEYGWYLRVYQASDAFGISYYYNPFTVTAGRSTGAGQSQLRPVLDARYPSLVKDRPTSNAGSAPSGPQLLGGD